ncbi:molybdate transport system substrate-binding protein [Paenibacillus phyllosphaerae]|uniref:Molybdate transport system substrate-binding protein n=1 Tax=Paenibacillus phyllosphaerae TaxID=274593 RepID=A0A7W5B404_9BACL|nr:molybdate ABC transporter substrate-binding protein [Paenibacillus phyllosphaerae]MBB3113536.1 molybdate transport system substrate-binding protein [Paenibacillus phyllosphaerae]
MKKQTILGLLLTTAMIGLAGCSTGSDQEKASGAAEPVTLIISTAASLQDAMEDIKLAYHEAHPEVELTLNYGSSGTLQKQIEQGAPADLFFSAGTSQVDALTEQALVEESTPLLRNDLVLIVPADRELAADDLTMLESDEMKKIAVGQPESVPAGKYAQETLQNVKLWDKLQPKLVFTKDVRQVLTYVESGNTDAGFVYRTDALASTKAKIVLQVKEELHQPIEYPAALLKDSDHMEEAKQLYDYLQSKEALAIFEEYGFTSASGN